MLTLKDGSAVNMPGQNWTQSPLGLLSPPAEVNSPHGSSAEATVGAAVVAVPRSRLPRSHRRSRLDEVEAAGITGVKSATGEESGVREGMPGTCRKGSEKSVSSYEDCCGPPCWCCYWCWWRRAVCGTPAGAEATRPLRALARSWPCHSSECLYLLL